MTTPTSQPRSATVANPLRRRLRHILTPSSLRSRLALGVVALAALGLVIVDSAAVVLQISYLGGHSEKQLRAVQFRLRANENTPHFQPTLSSTDRAALAALTDGYRIEFRTRTGEVTAHYTGAEQPTPEPPPDQTIRARGELDKVVPLAPDFFPIPLRTGYLMLAWERRPKDGITIATLDMSGPIRATATLLEIEILTSAAVLVLIATLALGAVRVGLAPLKNVTSYMGAIISVGDPSRRIAISQSPVSEIGELVTTLNTMLRALEEAFEHKRHSEERLRQFLADASHELRTPLAGIRGFAEMYRHGVARDDNEIAHLFSRIEADATRMGTLVDDLLLLAQLDQRRPPDAMPVDLLPIAADAVEAARAMAPTRPIRLELIPSRVANPQQTPVVLGDEHQLRQVVANLLSNALHHTPPDTPVLLRVGLRLNKQHAVIEVADQGPGLPPEDAPRVFERFYRAHKPTHNSSPTDQTHTETEPPVGAGLGLAIVAAIVTSHHGSVTYEPAPAGGALFRVTLPLALNRPAPGNPRYP